MIKIIKATFVSSVSEINRSDQKKVDQLCCDAHLFGGVF